MSMMGISNDYRTTAVSTLGNVWKTVWTICILMLGCKGFINARPPSTSSWLVSNLPVEREKHVCNLFKAFS